VDVNDRGLVAASILIGAVVGGLVGFLLFTERGRQIRAELQPHLDDLGTELRNLQDMALKIRDTATESWRQIDAFVGELGQPGNAPWAQETRRH
jgi:hypothetical protein